jgi:hypothetical protein
VCQQVRSQKSANAGKGLKVKGQALKVLPVRFPGLQTPKLRLNGRGLKPSTGKVTKFGRWLQDESCVPGKIEARKIAAKKRKSLKTGLGFEALASCGGRKSGI